MEKGDIEGIITCERSKPFISEYRPAHLIKDNYLTTGTHHYIGVNSIECGKSALVFITFVTPEAYPHCLEEGQKIIIQEGSNLVGYAIVVKILNELLRIK